MTLDQWREQVLKAVRQQKPAAGEDWAPVLLARRADGEQMVVELPPALLGTSDMPRLLDGLLQHLGATHFAHVCSAWAAPSGPANGVPACETCTGEGMMRAANGELAACPTCGGRGGPAQDLSKHPQRRELVTVALGDASGALEYHAAEIHRPKANKPPTLGPFDEMGAVGGRIANALRRT